jgi:hydroxymethylpyrimidine pyrophosphatase-like HAD family hydrolase
LEINQSGINKGKALNYILNNLNLNNENIIATGDGENDLSLFDIANLTFCPEDSLITVKNRANFIIDINEEGLFLPILKTIGLK